jgi:hypothetical protein
MDRRPRVNAATVKVRRTLCRLCIVGTSLWIISYSVVIYNAYREPYDLWLILDPADVKYSECWPKVPRTHSIARQPASRDVELDPDQLWYEAPWEGAARIRRVATCYRAINRSHHTTTGLDVLKQGGLTMIAVPVLVLGAGWLLLSFISDPRRRSFDD